MYSICIRHHPPWSTIIHYLPPSSTIYFYPLGVTFTLSLNGCRDVSCNFRVGSVMRIWVDDRFWCFKRAWAFTPSHPDPPRTWDIRNLDANAANKTTPNPHIEVHIKPGAGNTFSSPIFIGLGESTSDRLYRFRVPRFSKHISNCSQLLNHKVWGSAT